MQELRRNRAARDAAREDIELMHRERERSQHSEWQRTEREFEIAQAKERIMIRIQENRAKCIDLLFRFTKHCNGDEDDLPPFRVDDPMSYIRGLSLDDLEDLEVDVKAMAAIDAQENREFWADIKAIVEDKLRQNKPSSADKFSSVHPSLHDSVPKIFEGKCLADLNTMKGQIESKIANREPGTDVSYYESMLRHLVVHMAKMRLRDRYSVLLKRKLAQIKTEKVVDKESKYSMPEDKKIINENVDLPVTVAQMKEFDDEDREHQWEKLSEDQAIALSLAFYEPGRYSPTYGDESDTTPGIRILDPEKDRRLRSAKQAEMMSLARKEMDKDESTFAEEVNLGQQKLLWSDKHRPRKPKYENTLRTGFEWNKYNQTHYDSDNPPPKIVMGYSFKIFYPDLLDHTRTPSYAVTECGDPEFATIRFKSGPPYEDIALPQERLQMSIPQRRFGTVLLLQTPSVSSLMFR